MIQGILLIQGENISETISGIGLSNAKHIIIGDASGFGTLLQIAANTIDDFNNSLTEFVKTPEITITTLALRSSV